MTIDFNSVREAANKLRTTAEKKKNEAIFAVADAIRRSAEDIYKANSYDVEAFVNSGGSAALVDRLTLNLKRIQSVCDDMLKVAALPDPTESVISEWVTSDGLNIKKVAVPYGVIGVIYEARPNVTVDVFTLCLKSGNACILKGGKEAARTNEKIVEIIKGALKSTAVSPDCVLLLPPNRAYAETLIKARGQVDLIVPRGGSGLIRYVVENSLVPVIETGAGVCHTLEP